MYGMLSSFSIVRRRTIHNLRITGQLLHLRQHARVAVLGTSDHVSQLLDPFVRASAHSMVSLVKNVKVGHQTNSP
jgi:hypothetical protein